MFALLPCRKILLMERFRFGENTAITPGGRLVSCRSSRNTSGQVEGSPFRQQPTVETAVGNFTGSSLSGLMHLSSGLIPASFRSWRDVQTLVDQSCHCRVSMALHLYLRQSSGRQCLARLPASNALLGFWPGSTFPSDLPGLECAFALRLNWALSAEFVPVRGLPK